MERPEITVTMPAYNRADLIGRAIESVQQQTLSSWELIIVDDASTDATFDVAKSYSLSDPRIKVYRHDQNRGIGETRNHAVARSNGRFITPLDSDDWYHPSRLERLLTSANAHHAQLLCDDLLVVRDDEAPAATLSGLCHEPLVEPLTIDMAGLLRRLGIERDGIALGLTKPLIERQFLMDHGIRYDTTLPVGEDYWMLADCVAAGATFVMIPDALYNYRLHAQQMTKASAPAKDVLATKRRLEAFLDTDVANNDFVAAAIGRYHVQRMDHLLAYASFTDSLKAMRLGRATWNVLQHPSLLSEFTRRLPLAVDRRRRARRGDPFAFDQLFGPHLCRRVPAVVTRAPSGRAGDRQPARPALSRPDGLLRRWRLGSLRFARSLSRG